MARKETKGGFVPGGDDPADARFARKGIRSLLLVDDNCGQSSLGEGLQHIWH